MKIKVSELSGAALDWAVAKCDSRTIRRDQMGADIPGYWIWEETPSRLGGILITKSVYLKILKIGTKEYSPSTNWTQGGPIIEREGICISPSAAGLNPWVAYIPLKPTSFVDKTRCSGTPLIAAMRCYVASKLGDEIEVPKELI